MPLHGRSVGCARPKASANASRIPGGGVRAGRPVLAREALAEDVQHAGLALDAAEGVILRAADKDAADGHEAARALAGAAEAQSVLALLRGREVKREGAVQRGRLEAKPGCHREDLAPVQRPIAGWEG